LGALGEEKDAAVLLEQLASELPAGGQRSDVLVGLAWIRGDDMAAGFELAEKGLAEAGPGSRRAHAHSLLAMHALTLAEFAVARQHARRAVELGSEPGFVAQALAHEIMLDLFAGVPVTEEAVRRAERFDERLTTQLVYPVAIPLGLRQMYEDHH